MPTGCQVCNLFAVFEAPQWKGVFPSLPTPFGLDDGIDLAAQRRLVRFSIEAGAHGMLCFGLAGEVFKLTGAERNQLLEAIVVEADHRVPVLAGVGAEALHTSIALAIAAEAAGADAVVVPPPITSRSSRRELLRYFETIAGAVSVPVAIQDAPEYLNIEVGRDMVETLLDRCENVCIVKLEAGADSLGEWVDHFRGRAAIFGGSGGLYLLDSLAEGVAGFAPGVDMIDWLVEIYEMWTGGDVAAATARFERLLPTLLFQLQDIEHYNACAKFVLRQRGVLDHDRLRAPASQLGENGRRLMVAHLARMGVLCHEPTG